MKNNLRFSFIAIFLMFIGIATMSQTLPVRYFDSVRVGFDIGTSLTAQFPSEGKLADLNNDGDLDVVMSLHQQQNGFVVLLNSGNGFFSPPVRYAASLGATDIVVADFNGDGWKDIAVTDADYNYFGNQVAVFTNSGGAVFGTPVYFTVGTAPTGIVAADLDNDSDIDLAVCNYNYFGVTSSVSILTNNGTGSFGNATHFPAGNRAYKLAVGNIDNDNYPDLVVANDSQKINILINTPGNNFSNRTEKTVLPYQGTNVYPSVAIADMDMDNDNDIMYSSTWSEHSYNYGAIALFRNNGSASFTSPEKIQLAYFTGGSIDMEIADMNNDGKQDIVGNYFSGRNNDGAQVLLGNGDGTFQPSTIIAGGQATFAVMAGDADGDSYKDLLTVDRFSLQLTVHKNLGDGTFYKPPFYLTNSVGPGSLDAADIDGDGDLDIVTSAAGRGGVGVAVTVQLNNGDGTFTPGIPYSIRSGGVQAKFRDLNGDNFPDLVFATSIASPPYDFHTAINNGNGTFGPRQTWPMGGCGWFDIEAVDLDNDGDRDVVITEDAGCQNVLESAKRIFISKNDGAGNFGAPLIKVINPSPKAIVAGDFNGDNKMDIITGQGYSTDLHLGTGTGDLLPPVKIDDEQNVYDLIAKDLNGDGKLDVAAVGGGTFYRMFTIISNGDGTFQPATTYHSAYSPDIVNFSGITSGDIDCDNDPDLLVGNNASGDVSFFENNGSGTFTLKHRYGAYYAAASPFYADFSGDGKGDIVVAVALPPGGFTGAITLLKGITCSVIPLNLTRFEGACSGNSVRLEWHTEVEINTSHFVIEKTSGGGSWSTIATVTATGTANTYSYTDEESGEALYRLRMTDRDQNFTYSETISARCSRRNIVSVYPIPARNTIFINADAQKQKTVTVQLLETSGRVVRHKQVNLLRGHNTIRYELKGVASGLYLIRLVDAEGSEVKLITVQ